MIELSNDEILSQHEKYMKAYLSSSGTSFLEDTYIKKIFPRLYKERNLVYPYDVRIAPSITEMLQGNFEPSRIIHIEKPFIGPYGVPIWFGDAAKGATMLCGYVNGDSRYPCEVAFDDKTAHGLIGGATGQGKSVLMNSIIWGMCLCYPPWALDLTLSDAKIVEFKSIAVSSPLPNISAIAATGDADYLISILEDKFEEMSKLNKVFTEASKTFKQSIKNLNDFIQITGLMYPRHVMLFDEGQAMFDNAGKKLGVPCLVVGIVVTGLLGYPNVKTILEDKANYDLVANTYKQSVDTYKKKEKEYKALNTDNLDVVLESYLDNTAIAEAIANFSGGKLESITAFKGAGSEAVDIIEVSKPSDVAYFTKAIDGMRFSVKYSSLNKFLKSVQNSGISSDNLEIDVNKKGLPLQLIPSLATIIPLK